MCILAHIFIFYFYFSMSSSSSSSSSHSSVAPISLQTTQTRQPSLVRLVDIEDANVCSECHLSKTVAEVQWCCPKTVRNLEPGKEYLWCRCGKSTNEPFCDGVSCPDGVKPLAFRVNVQQSFWSICMCKYSQNPPLCDGTHAGMPATPTVSPCACDRSTQW